MAIPHTRTRLKGYILLKASPGGIQLAEYHYDGQMFADNAMSNLVTIGAAQQLTVDQTREGNFRREFANDENKLDGKPAETYPGLSSYKLNLQRVELYDSNFGEAFKLRGDNPSVNVADQYKPLVLEITQPVPLSDTNTELTLPIDGDPGSITFKQRTYYIVGCWMNNLQIEWNVDDDNQKYVQSVDMVVRDVQLK